MCRPLLVMFRWCIDFNAIDGQGIHFLILNNNKTKQKKLNALNWRAVCVGERRCGFKSICYGTWRLFFVVQEGMMFVIANSKLHSFLA
jgi:hypothetical protein